MREVRSSAVRYTLAILFSAVAVAFRWALDPWLAGQTPLLTVTAAIAASVWVGGYRAGLVTMAAGYIAADYLFIAPGGPGGLSDARGFGPYSAIDLIRIVAYGITAAIIITFGEVARGAWALKEQARADADRRQAEEAEWALKNTQERFSRFMHHLPGLAWIKDVQGRYVFANDAAVKAFGIGREALYGRTDADLFPAEVAADFSANDRRALESGAGVQAVEVLEHEDGVMHSSIVSKFPIPGPTGEAAWVGGMAIDITERMRAEEAVREADRRKTDFLATLSHELRNPLAPIRNSLELVRRSSGDPLILRSSVDVIDRQISHMVRLVDDLLDVSRITRDRLELRRRRVELADAIAQAIETCADNAERGGHTIEVSLPSEPVSLHADSDRLVQIFSNLLNNACKYSGRPGCIRIDARIEATEAVVSVADEGIGIPSDALERIFEMFAQVESAREQSRNSLGIGLTLVKRLVELHGGSVVARSDGPDRGSEFVVRLPLAPARQEAPAPLETPPVPVLVRSHAAPPLRVLVVDDNEDSAESLATLLTLGGHKTITAHDGAEALVTADQFRPHVAILDVGLPTLSGHDVCRHLRDRPWGHDLFIVALTGWGQEEDRRKSREAGFDEHFVKPLDHSELLNRLRAVSLAREVPS